MGTNYYVENEPPCPHCGRPYESRHIGKSSGGWCFSLHVYPDEGIKSLADWEREWSGKRIRDEYGSDVSVDGMLETITKRTSLKQDDWARKSGYRDECDFHEKNHSQRGPNGLLRHRIGDHCIGHGDGTWDLISSDFS